MRTLTGINKLLFFTLLIIIILYFGRAFLVPIAIATVMATFLLPLCRWIEAKRIYKSIAVTICLLLVVLFLLTLTSIVTWQLNSLTGDLSQIKIKADSLKKLFHESFLFKSKLINTSEVQLLDKAPNILASILPSIIESLTLTLTQSMLTLVYIFGILYNRKHIKNFLVQIFPSSENQNTEQTLIKVSNVSQQYLIGLSKMIFCLWIMYGIGFSALGVKNAIFFAILCGVLEIIPFIGNITGTSITLITALLYGSSTTTLIGIVAVYGVIQLIQGWLLEPLILGPQVKINALFTIIALVGGNLIWGIPGIFLAIPIIAMFKIICDQIESLKPIGFLISTIEETKK